MCSTSHPGPAPGRHGPGHAAGIRQGMRLLDPALNDLSPQHLSVFWHYQVVRTLVDFGAALSFVVGSACFFFSSTQIAADWLFLIGSILFAAKPTIDVVRSAHLKRLPGQSDGPLHHSSGQAGTVQSGQA